MVFMIFGKIPSIRSLVDSLAIKMHPNLDLLLSFVQRVSRTSCLSFYMAWPGLSELPIFSVHSFDSLFEFNVLGVIEVNTSQPSGIVELRFLDCPILLLSDWSSLTCLCRFPATNNLAWMLLAVLSVSSRTMYTLLEAFLSIK